MCILMTLTCSYGLNGHDLETHNMCLSLHERGERGWHETVYIPELPLYNMLCIYLLYINVTTACDRGSEMLGFHGYY